MNAVNYSLERVDGMIDFIEEKIEGNAVTPALLGGLQERLDAIDAAYHGDPKFGQYYPRMLELQALIYGEGNEEEKALQFIKEAVRQAGSVRELYSKLIKRYILSQSRLVAAADMSVQPAPAANKSKHASELHVRPGFRSMKVAFAVIFGLIVVSVATLHFVPQAAALPVMLAKHSEINNAKQKFDALTAEYNICSSKLASERGSIDTNDMAAVDVYNQDTKNCQVVLQQQHQAANRYDALIGA